MAKTPKAT